MSLAINIATPEGIVMAADSRQSYRNQKGASRVGSDSASKLFLLNPRVGLAITGLAFIPEDGMAKNVSNFINEFCQSNDLDALSLREIADGIHKLFSQKLDSEKRLEDIEKDGRTRFIKQGLEIVSVVRDSARVKFTLKDSKTGVVQEAVGVAEGVVIMVCGYDKDGSHAVYNISVPGEVVQHRNSLQKGKEYGANWLGQFDVVARIIKGWDGRILSVGFVQEAVKQIGQANIEHQLNQLEYSINWGAMTLQDAVDFSILAVKTTEAVQKFSDGILANPGDIPGVGGPVDVLVLTAKEAFWVSKKKIDARE
ncbi:MAG: hypothetical protein WC400_02035 [Patescibacteria group bacterium]|jgi:hypothetical protein